LNGYEIKDLKERVHQQRRHKEALRRGDLTPVIALRGPERARKGRHHRRDNFFYASPFPRASL